MAELSYHYRKKRRLKKKWRWAVAIFLLCVLVIGGLIAYDIFKNRAGQQTGEANITQLTYDDQGPKMNINEPTYKMQLPGDWRETHRTNNKTENSVTWQATKPKEDNRFISVYVDTIPRNYAVNKLLPLEAVGSKLRRGEVSDNCAAYTAGGAIDADAASKSKVTLAKWEEVSFLCDLPRVFDNVVGTSSKEGVNIVGVTGEKKGKHNYFFVYTDHNIRPNYDILLDIVESFEAL